MQQNAPNRLRQRLLGALVIVALAVLILPPWMDGGGLKTPAVLPVPPAPIVDQPANISVPTPTPAQQAALINPPKPFLPAEEPKPASSSPPAADKAVPEAATHADVAPPADSSAQSPASASPADHVAHEKPGVGSSVQPSEPPPAKQPTPSPEPKARPESAATKPANGQEWVVQLGSFSDELNARGLAKSVTDAGFKVDIYPLFAKKGTVWRVRVGPFATREQAVKTTTQLRERLGRDGLVMPK